MDKIIKSLLYLVLLTPLIYFSDFLFPFVSAKSLWFNSLIGFSFILHIWHCYKNKQPIFQFNKLDKWLLAFIALIFFTSFYGVDLYQSWFGNFERSNGLLFFFNLFLYYYLLRRYISNWSRYLSVFLLVSATTGLIAFFQWQGTFPFLQLFTNPHGKVWSVLGNYIYLGNFSLFGIFLSLFLYSRSTHWGLKALAILSFFLSFQGIFLAASRGPFIGLIIGSFALWLIYFIKGSTRERYILGGIFLAILGLLVLFYMRPSAWLLHHLPGWNVMSDVRFTGSIKTRILAWGVAWQSFLQRPLLGWGNENFAYAYNLYFNPESFHIGGLYEMSFDRAHNYYFDRLVEQGIGGLVLWLLVMWQFLKESYLKHEYFITALLIASAVSLNFVFLDLSNYIALFLLFAFLNRYENHS